MKIKKIRYRHCEGGTTEAICCSSKCEITSPDKSGSQRRKKGNSGAIFRTAFVLFSFMLFTQMLSAQIVFDKSTYNFGDINQGDKLTVDFKLTNAGKTPAVIKNVETPYGVAYLYSRKRIDPDSTVLLRLYYIPKIKGKFKKEINVYISVLNKPLQFTIKGNLKFVVPNASLTVPPFPKAVTQKEKPMAQATFNVIDANTKAPVNNAAVKIIWNGLDYKDIHSYANGQCGQKLYIGSYYLVVDATGYKTAEMAIDLSENKNSFTIKMNKGTNPPPPVAVEDTMHKAIPKDTTKAVVKTPPAVQQEGELSTKLYKPNNIVFLIDQSESMKYAGKLDLLKASMIKLLSVLRPIDRIAVVAFSKESHVIVQSQYCKDKASIQKAIRKIKPMGYNKLNQGIRVAYNVSRYGLIRGGNNMVIVATDGDYNVAASDSTIFNEIAKKAKDGIRISVIGIKIAYSSLQSLQALAKQGNGSYISINSYSDAENNLVNEIKSKSLIKE